MPLGLTGLWWVSHCSYTLIFSNINTILVLHPHHKLEYFKSAGWEDDWIATARNIVCLEYECSYVSCSVPQPNKITEESEENVSRTIKVHLLSLVWFWPSLMYVWYCRMMISIFSTVCLLSRSPQSPPLVMNSMLTLQQVLRMLMMPLCGGNASSQHIPTCLTWCLISWQSPVCLPLACVSSYTTWRTVYFSNFSWHRTHFLSGPLAFIPYLFLTISSDYLCFTLPQLLEFTWTSKGQWCFTCCAATRPWWRGSISWGWLGQHNISLIHVVAISDLEIQCHTHVIPTMGLVPTWPMHTLHSTHACLHPWVYGYGYTTGMGVGRALGIHRFTCANA
jgi:hypothetical protein